MKFWSYDILPGCVFFIAKNTEVPVTDHIWKRYKCPFLKRNGYEILKQLPFLNYSLLFNEVLINLKIRLYCLIAHSLESSSNLVFLFFIDVCEMPFLRLVFTFSSTCCYRLQFVPFLVFFRFWKVSNTNCYFNEVWKETLINILKPDGRIITVDKIAEMNNWRALIYALFWVF